MDALVNYQVQDSKDAEKIVERVLPRLQHVNSAVVLSAAKVSWGMPEAAPPCASMAQPTGLPTAGTIRTGSC